MTVPVGSVITQLTVPVGTTGNPSPETVVVRVVTPPSVGFGEATTTIPGVCLTIVNESAELEADR